MKKTNKISTFRGNMAFLSNYYDVPVEYDGITYKNSESAFQAQKCTDYEKRKEFSKLDPVQAKILGRSVKLRSDWEQVKVGIMREIVQAKFEQNPRLAKDLLATGDAHLEEGNDWGETFWGTMCGKGKNVLGQILMDVRETLKSDPNYSK